VADSLLILKMLPLVLVCSIGPGLLIVRRRRWSPMEKLCAVFSTSFIAVYLASFTLFCLNAPVWAYWTASAAFLMAGVAGWRTARLFLHRRDTRRVLLAFAFVLAWEAMHMAMVRAYSGGDWQGDWREHYERTQIFIRQFPIDFLMQGVSPLPARPPLMNAAAAFFCCQVGLSFQAYQLMFLCWNSWTFLPCCLLLRFFARRGQRLVAPLAVLFMLNPSIVQNATLTVTKALTAGLVVLGVCFYLRRRVVPAAVTLAAALLTHYSAGPYAVAIGLHCLYETARRRQPLGRTVAAGGAATLLLAPWFIWSIAVFGARVTFFSNTTAVGTSQYSPGANFHKVIFNLISCAIPHPLRPVAYKPFSPPHNWGDVRDYYFMMAQTTLPTMVGITGGAVALGLIIRFLRAPPRPWPFQKSFWLYFLLLTYFLAAAVDPGFNSMGIGYVTMQSLALMGVTLVAANLTELRPWVFRLVWAGLGIDYAFGILLEFDRESYAYPTITGPDGRIFMLPDYTLGGTGASEFLAKLQHGYVFWGDHLARAGTAFEILSLVTAVCALWYFKRFGAKA
jgi:hypothetical protein